MPGSLFHVGAQAICPHAGQVTTMSSNTRVLVGGQPAILQTSSAQCLSPEQIPQGPPSVLVTQLRARGT